MNTKSQFSYLRGGWREPCSQLSGGYVMKIFGLILIVVGLAVLAMGGINYTKTEKVLDIGPIKATTETQKHIPLSPIAGIAALAVGVALVVSGSRTRA